MSHECGDYTYKDDEEIGSGSYGCAYLARNEKEKEEGKKRLYVIKFPLGDKMDEGQKKDFDNEVDILRKLSQIPDNKCTSIAYASKTFKEIKNANEEKPYYVMDYFSRGLLFSYVASGQLTQRQAKFLFKKLIESFQFLHEKSGILHFDIKLDNIILDNEFRPVIIDFTFSKQYRDKDGNITPVTTTGGSEPYRAPEIYEGKKVKDEKADIFSLGAILFNLITCRPGFDTSENKKNLYRLIRKKKYESYWNKMSSLNLSEDFKDLYQRMVAYEPDERPTFDEILKHPFLKDVINLTPEEENKIREELEILFTTEIINSQGETYEYNESVINNEHLTTRAGESKQDEIFEDKSIQPKKISKDRLLLNQAIKITGNIPEVDFMNSLYRDIKYKYADHSYIEASKTSLKMEVVFEYEDNEEEEKKEEEKKEEEKEVEKIGEHFGDCKMEIELFKYQNGEYLLEFLRTGGKFPDYYNHFLEIKKLILNKNK